MYVLLEIYLKRQIPTWGRETPYLDLVNIYLSILFAHLFVRDLHRVDRGHGIPEIVSCEGRGFHIKRLLSKLRNLGFVHPLLLQCPESSLLDSVLEKLNG
jgi:hypothetical protein